MQLLFDLTLTQWTAIAWALGALWSLLLPYYRKWRESGKTLEFNFAYLVNFVISIITGLTVAFSMFLTWVPPDTIAPVVIVIAFFAGAGVDKNVIQEILKLVDFYQKLWNKLHPELNSG